MGHATSTTTHGNTPSNSGDPEKIDVDLIERRLRNALWSFYAGDALASPTHWFYGGSRQVQQYYGRDGIRTYTKPVFELAGSILNKSNLSGGGRSASSVFGGGSDPGQRTIIGEVINHGKAKYWDPSEQIHYHATLEAGENTLEASLGRVLMRSISTTDGQFDADHFRHSYYEFMTTPNSHNDTYASTCHRMFFANLIYKKRPLKDCPDNDAHNVDTIDGLVLPTIVSLAVAARNAAIAAAASQAKPSEDTTGIESSPSSFTDAWEKDALQNAIECVDVTRNSKPLQAYAAAWSQLVGTALLTGKATEKAIEVADMLRLRQKPSIQNRDVITACYLDSAFPALLDNIVTYEHDQTPVWEALLRNANTGGENVHRGSCLGAVLGTLSSATMAAQHRPDQPPIDLETTELAQGLYHREQIKQEIDDFVNAVMMKQSTTEETTDTAANSK